MIEKSQSDVLLELIAISGEYPSDKLPRIIESYSYRKRILAGLQADKLIKIVYRNQLRGYKLTFHGKRRLLDANKMRFGFFLEGEVETNRLKSDLTRRLRLHEITEVYTTMYNSKLSIFRDLKQEPFANTVSVEANKAMKIDHPSFYASREYKNMGEQSNKIRGSRASGVLLTETDVFMVYNTGDKQVQWGSRIEIRSKAEMQNYICRNPFLPQYKKTTVKSILLASNFEMLLKHCDTTDNKNKGLHLVNSLFEQFYFVTNDTFGKTQLRFLCDTKRYQTLQNIFLNIYSPSGPNLTIENDGIDNDGNSVLMCCIPNLPRLIRYQIALRLQDRRGRVICFDYQLEVLKEFFGQRVMFEIVDLAKVERRFFKVCRVQKK